MNDLNPSATQTRRAPASVRTPRRRLGIRVLWSLIIFASGGVAGTGITLLVIRDRVLHAIHHPEEMPALIAARMRGNLDLSGAQVLQVESILNRRQLAIQAIRRQFQPQVESELDRVEKEISTVLNDEQHALRCAQNFEQLRGDWMPSPPPETSNRTAAE